MRMSIWDSVATLGLQMFIEEHIRYTYIWAHPNCRVVGVAATPMRLHLIELRTRWNSWSTKSSRKRAHNSFVLSERLRERERVGEMERGGASGSWTDRAGRAANKHINNILTGRRRSASHSSIQPLTESAALRAIAGIVQDVVEHKMQLINHLSQK